ncbi:MAG: hypothetical protein R3A44_01690 [Caldilineaceae bacterium]
MNEIEQYEFDRLGYIVIKEMLTAAEVAALAAAIDELEEHALARIQAPPRKRRPGAMSITPTPSGAITPGGNGRRAKR